MCESRGGRPGLPVANSLYGVRGRKATLNLKCVISELRSCVKVEVDVLGSTSLIVLMVGLCGCKATLNLNSKQVLFTKAGLILQQVEKIKVQA